MKPRIRSWSLVAAIAAICGLLADSACAQTELTGNQAAVEIAGRTNLTRFKDDLRTLSNMGTRTYYGDGPSASNDSGVAYVKREMEKAGYVATIYGVYRSIYCTKIGAIRPDSMYLVSGHIDGVGGSGGACDDNGSGTSLTLEAMRAFAGPAIKTRYSIRFAIWNMHEGGWKGSDEYLKARRSLQGKESPAGSGLYPEPVWRALINTDMILYDHGMPAGPVQIAGADIDVHYSDYAYPQQSLALANQLVDIGKVVPVNYPAQTTPNLNGSDAVVFVSANACPCVDLRENDRNTEIDKGASPTHHDESDVYATYSDADFALGYSAVRRVVGVLSVLTKATVTTSGTSAQPAAREGDARAARDAPAIHVYDASGRLIPASLTVNPANSSPEVHCTPGEKRAAVKVADEKRW